MRQRWFQFLCLLLGVTLLAAACGSGDDDAAAPSAEGGSATTAAQGSGGGASGSDIKVGMVYDLGGRGDQSFNDAAARGLDRAKAEFGIQTKELEPAEGGQNREELVRLLADQDYQMVFGVGFLFEDSLKAAAPDFPDVTFGQIDSVVDAPNAASLTFAEEQGSYLMGAAAALKSKTGKVGFIGGVEQDLIKRFEAGFTAGAKKINPSAQVDVKYITQPPDFTGFNDPAKGKEIALGQYSGGADVIYHAAGGSGGGLFQAAKEVSDRTGTKHWAIGVDSDQYNIVDASLKPHVLTSMLKKVDVAVYDTVKRQVQGAKPTGLTTYDLKAGGIDYSTTGGFVDDIKGQLDDLKNQIIAGQITVPKAPA